MGAHPLIFPKKTSNFFYLSPLYKQKFHTSMLTANLKPSIVLAPSHLLYLLQAIYGRPQCQCSGGFIALEVV
jgi:hypothetical protein